MNTEDYAATARILDGMTPGEKLLWRAKLDASRAETEAENALRQAKKALAVVRRAQRKANLAFERTPTGAAWVAEIRRRCAANTTAHLAARQAATQPAAA